jgi:hypothetical protein
MPRENAPIAPPRASRTAPAEPTTLPELEEVVRARLVAHGQHGALDAFGKYTAAVNAKLALTSADLGAPESSNKQLLDALEKPKASKPAKAKKAK